MLILHCLCEQVSCCSSIILSHSLVVIVVISIHCEGCEQQQRVAIQ